MTKKQKILTICLGKITSAWLVVIHLIHHYFFNCNRAGHLTLLPFHINHSSKSTRATSFFVCLCLDRQWSAIVGGGGGGQPNKIQSTMFAMGRVSNQTAVI